MHRDTRNGHRVVEGESPDRLDVLTVGETMGLLSTVRPGLLRHQRTLELSIGGAESNLAIAVSRMGLRSAWIGRIGDDEVGALVCRELVAEGVLTRAIVDPAAATGLMLKESLDSAARRVWYYRRDSAGSRLCPDDIDPVLAARARIVHVTGITPGISATAAAAVTRLVDLATEAGALVSLDLNYRAAIWQPEQFRVAVRPLMARADLVFGSVEELYLATHGRPPGAAEQMPEKLAHEVAGVGPETVVVKRGADGALAVVDGQVVAGSAVPVEVVDPVGAGDAFVAGWLVALLRGEPAEQRLRLGLTAGALACTAAGDWEGAPTLHRLAARGTADPVLR